MIDCRLLETYRLEMLGEKRLPHPWHAEYLDTINEQVGNHCQKNWYDLPLYLPHFSYLKVTTNLSIKESMVLLGTTHFLMGFFCRH